MNHTAGKWRSHGKAADEAARAERQHAALILDAIGDAALSTDTRAM